MKIAFDLMWIKTYSKSKGKLTASAEAFNAQALLTKIRLFICLTFIVVLLKSRGHVMLFYLSLRHNLF